MINQRLLVTFWSIIFLCLACTGKISQKTIVIGFSQCTNNDLWRQTMLNDMQRELHYHDDYQLVMRNAQDNNDLQIRQIDSFIQEKVDLLIVSPNESAPVTQAVEKAFKNHIPVIIVDRKISSQFFNAYLGADNREIGRLAGSYVANIGNTNAKILEIWGLPGSSPAQERHDGFAQGISELPGARIIGKVYGSWNKDDAAKAIPQFEKEIREADIIFGHNDIMTLAAWEYCQKLGIEKTKKFIGVDGLPGKTAGLQWVSDGILSATILYPTGGEETIQLASKILNQERINKENIMQSTVIDGRNVRVMIEQAEKILSQQSSIERQQNLLREQKKLYDSQRNISLFLLFSLITSLLLGIFLWKTLVEKRGAIQLLEKQKTEIEQQRNQIIDVSQQAEEASRGQIQFFTNISHEFRTPLTLILGAVEGLINGSSNSREAKSDAGLIRQNALRLLRLVNQLMDFRKIENGKMRVRANEHDLTAFVHNIIRVFEKYAEKRHIILQFYGRDGAIPLWFDENMLDKVLFNILSNAFKFTPQGGRITVSAEMDSFSRQAILRIEDNGKGMSAENAAQAFEKFYQADNDRSVGTGLGLALSRDLVALHHGEILLWSEINVGTRFEIRLPLGNEHFTKDEMATEKAAERAGYDEVSAIYMEENLATNIAMPEHLSEAKKHKILIIDDNDDLRQFLARKLSAHYQVFSAEDGNTGLNRAFNLLPDLILADINMPGKNGLQITQTIKSDMRTGHIPVVLLTARATMEQKIEGIQSGADAYVTKPFNLEFLGEIIKNLLNGRSVLRERFSGNFVPDERLATSGQNDLKFAQRFVKYIEENYGDQKLSVEQLSQEMGMSRVQLYRKVKKLFDESVNDYIQRVRLKKAAGILLESDLSVSEIAYTTGYSSPGYFATAFRARYHCTPGEYREKAKGDPKSK